MTEEQIKQKAEEKYCKGCKWRMEQCLWAWRNTNGLNEPNEKNCSCKEVPAFIDGYHECQKEHEWHYVKDGDLPKEESRPRTHGYYLTALKHKSYKWFVFEVAYFTGVVFTRGGNILDNVYAWKEIVLPKLPKESE